MRIVVCMKQVYDPKTVKISRSREEFDLREAVKITNPPDKLALETALRLREANGGGEVIALTAGEAQAEDVVREAIAIGADRGLLIADAELAAAGGRAVAKALAAAISLLSGVDLVLTGQAGLTDGAGSLAPRLAAELDWPVVLDAVGVSHASAGDFEATVASDDGAVAHAAGGPSRSRHRSRPRSDPPALSLPGGHRQCRQPGLVEICTPRELGLDAEALAPDVEPGGLVLPPERTRGEVIGGSVQDAAEQLVGILRMKRMMRLRRDGCSAKGDLVCSRTCEPTTQFAPPCNLRRNLMGMDLSYLEALMGGAAADTGGGTGGVWVVSADGAVDDGILRLVGKARVVADALGTYVHLLLAGGAEAEPPRLPSRPAPIACCWRRVCRVGRSRRLFPERAPQLILFPRTRLGRTLGPGLAQTLDGGLCGHAADLEVDPIYQRIVAHQPVLEDAARQRVTLVAAPAVAVVDTGALPAAFNEPWRTGTVEDAG